MFILRASETGRALLMGSSSAVSIAAATPPVSGEYMNSLTSPIGYNLSWAWPHMTPRFIDRAKQGEWQGDRTPEGNLADNGQPTRRFVICGDDTNMTPQDISYRGGHFTLEYDGGAGATPSGFGGVTNFTGSNNSYEFDMAATFAAIQFDNINYADPPRNLRIVEDVNAQAYAEGKLFEPKMLENNQHAGVFRFMQWAQINDGIAGDVGIGNTCVEWDDYPGMDHQLWNVVPYRAQIEMCNEAHVHGWFCIPHQANDAFVSTLAQLIHDHLDPELTAYIEYSNECWNWGYRQPHWLSAQAEAAWGVDFSLDSAMNWYGKRVVEIVDLFEVVFGVGNSRIKPMLATQNWDHPTYQMMYAPRWQTADPANWVAPHTKVDTIAMAGYIPGSRDFYASVEGGTAIWNALQNSQAEAKALMIAGVDAQMAPNNFTEAFSVYELALAEGLQPIVYEGSDHLDLQEAFANYPGNPLTNGVNAASPGVQELFEAVTYSEEMADLHRELKDLMRYAGGGVFVEFDDIDPTTEYSGNWGMQRTREDVNPLDTYVRNYATDATKQLPYARPDAGHAITENTPITTVGHSLMDQSVDMLDYFMRYAPHTGSGAVSHQSIAGAGLEFQWENAATIPTIDARALLAGGNQRAAMFTESVPNVHVQGAGWDYQNNTYQTPIPSPSSPYTTGQDVRAWVKWHNLAADNGVTHIYVYEPWQDFRSGTASQGDIEDQADPDIALTWEERIAVDAPRNADFVNLLRTGEHPALGYTATITPGTTIQMIPAAQVMLGLKRALDDNLGPEAVTYTDFATDMLIDDIHPSIPARYAIACAMYAVMFKRCPIGMPHDLHDIHGGNFNGAWTGPLASYNKRWLQAIAWRAVKNHPLTGLD